MKQILVLGAGRVARPLVKYFQAHAIPITVADTDLKHAQEIVGNSTEDTVLEFDVQDSALLRQLVADHKVVVSLLPFPFHPAVARACIEERRHLVTTSYVQPEMEQLDDAARQAGVLLLNEIGLDPGIDHLSAMQLIGRVRQAGGRVLSFRSFCGALPAPEAAQNPFGYRFSWSPRGVLLAANNQARYRLQGKEVLVSADELFSNPLRVDFQGLGTLEMYPNRDSVVYAALYGIEEAQTVIRGTFRFPGWCESVDLQKKVGLFSEEPTDCTGITYRQLVAKVAGLSVDGDLAVQIAGRFNLKPGSVGLKAMEWLGLFEDTPVGSRIASPFDLLAERMLMRMELGPDDRDMTVMQHQLEVEYPDGAKYRLLSNLLDYGVAGGDTSIARTVALPAAIAARLILEKKLEITGVRRPLTSELYEPVLRELAMLGISLSEKAIPLQ